MVAVGLIIWSQVDSSAEQNNQLSDQSNNQSDVISTNGLHWHSILSIRVHGEPVTIPSNIGLMGGHSPMHTHESDGTIHLEFGGMVRESDITLGTFFDQWGKEFSDSQILEYTNSETEKVTMYVNGEVNTEYENYVLQDDDEIEIAFE